MKSIMTSATLYCTPTRLSQPRNEEVNTNKSNNNKASVVDEARQVQSYRRIVKQKITASPLAKDPIPYLGSADALLLCRMLQS